MFFSSAVETGRMRPPVLQFGVPGGVEMLILLFVFAFSLVLPLVVSFLIYRDANRQGSHHALAWGLGAFFGSLVVWILYVVVRDEVGPGGPPQSETPPRYDGPPQAGEQQAGDPPQSDQPPQSGGPRQ
jgi:hypothetical protein